MIRQRMTGPARMTASTALVIVVPVLVIACSGTDGGPEASTDAETDRVDATEVATEVSVAVDAKVGDEVRSDVTAPCTPETCDVRAFPTAEGFGSKTPGGRGGRVIHVTSLADSGPGTLRQAVEVQTGPRIVVFDVGGDIRLATPLRIRGEDHSYVTVAGQTAPGGGIQLLDEPVIISSAAHDVVLRHLRIRPGLAHAPTPTGSFWIQNALVVYGNDSHVHHVVIDHCTTMWAADETVSVWSNATDVTLQWSLVAEGLTEADHPDALSKGILTGSFTPTVSIHHNLIAHFADRSPTAGGDTLDFRNNVIYDWGGNNAAKFGNQCGSYDSKDRTPQVNFVGNVYIPGSGSLARAFWIGGSGTRVFALGNYAPLCPTGCADDWNLGFQTARFTPTTCPRPAGAVSSIGPSPEDEFRAKTPIVVPPVGTTPTADVETLVLAKAGATLPSRDREDARIVNEVRTRTGSLGMHGTPPPLAAGTAPRDVDGDGMPDAWEKAHALDPADATDGSRTAPNGYTNVENYLNELAGDPIP